MALDATPQGTASNSYATVAEADAYFAGERPNVTTWASRANADKEALLIFATRVLEQFFEWDGDPRNVDQALAHPRYGLFNRDDLEYPRDVVADEVKRAQYEIAHYHGERDRVSEPALLGQGFSSAGAAGATIKVDPNERLSLIPDHVIGMLRDFGRPLPGAVARPGIRSVPLRRA